MDRGFIWNIADDRLRDVILPFTVLRRLDAVLEPTKSKVLAQKKLLDKAKIASQEGALRKAAGQRRKTTSGRSTPPSAAITSG